MRRGLFAAAALLVAGCDAPAPRPADQWPIGSAELAAAAAPSDPGEAAYRRTCIACHGADGGGNGAKTGASFTAQDGPLTRPDAELLASIRDGKKGPIGVMPPHRALLTEAETVSVLAYVRRTFGPTIVPTSASAAPSASAPASASASAGPAAPR